MKPKQKNILHLISILQERIETVADPDTKSWFENYLKDVISYRGVRTPVIRKLLKAWVNEFDISRYPNNDQLEMVLSLLGEPIAEDKLAGIILLQEELQHAEPMTLLSTIENAFEQGYLFDWSTTDWLCVRVLDPLIIEYGQPVAQRIAKWSQAQDLWQRRASVVSFRHAVEDPLVTPLIEDIIARLVGEEHRFIQTGIGWIIADWSKVDEVHVSKLVLKHFDDLSREVIDRHTKHLPDHKTYKARKRLNTLPLS